MNGVLFFVKPPSKTLLSPPSLIGTTESWRIGSKVDTQEKSSHFFVCVHFKLDRNLHDLQFFFSFLWCASERVSGVWRNYRLFVKPIWRKEIPIIDTLYFAFRIPWEEQNPFCLLQQWLCWHLNGERPMPMEKLEPTAATVIQTEPTGSMGQTELSP